MNDKIKKARLDLDKHECQLSKLFGIASLSGKPCSDELQVHHISYERCGHEPIGDLITVCTRCHDVLTDAIRRERYSVNLTQHGEGIAGQCPDSGQEGKKNVREIELQDCRSGTADYAQWQVGKPRGRIRQSGRRLTLTKKEALSGAALCYPCHASPHPASPRLTTSCLGPALPKMLH